MLLYRGDRFVKDKKFTINEQVYRFVKRDNDNKLIFESLKDNTKLVLDEVEILKEEICLFDNKTTKLK